MALTDATFLLAWLVAIGLGQRFVERPGPWRALVFGVAVGVAQLFKYNGWLAGAAIAGTVALWTAIRRDERRGMALWGWGVVAALAAALVYWPWFRFVETHGGYGSLLAHQRSYLGGFGAWRSHMLVQFQQERAMSGGFAWMLLTGLAGAIALLVASGDLRRGRRLTAVEVVTALSLPADCVLIAAFLLSAYAGSLIIFLRIRNTTPAALVLAVGWTLLAILTPFYHPYARLFLPLQALCWILMAYTVLNGRTFYAAAGARGRPFLLGVPSNVITLAILIWAFTLAIPIVSTYWEPARTIGEVLGPSDSLRRACGQIASDLKGSRTPLRLYARPPVTFYLSGAVPVAPQSSEQALFNTSDPGARALLDAAMVGQGGGVGGPLPPSSEHWEVVREYPSTMNLPTLLDVDPAAAVDPSKDRSAPLLLFRPKSVSGAFR